MIEYRVCRLCTSFMHSHPTLRGWLKCACGFSKIESPVIKFDQYLMGRDKLYPSELTQEVINNIYVLLEKVNALLFELNIKSAKVSSGWRPAAINSSIPTSAKKSHHMTGKAVDILDDKDQSIGNLILSKPDLLKKYDLWLEDLSSTKGKNTNWVHLDIGTRSDRPVRVFKP
jgi:hypothetical protein